MQEFDSNLAVVAIILNQDKVLLLKRNQEPFGWCPPSGMVHVHEQIEAALHREILEETGLSVQIVMPVQTWQGIHRGGEVLSITFVCLTPDWNIQLSAEHSDFQWVELHKITEFQDTVFTVNKWPALVAAARTYLTYCNDCR